METILTQKFSFASITPYKDYSKISDKPKSPNTFDIEETQLENEYSSGSESIWDTRLDGIFRVDTTGRTYQLPEKLSYTKKRLNFFYDHTDIHEKFKIFYAYRNAKTEFGFDTVKDNQIKRHFGRPFSSIALQTIERSIFKNGDKVTIKIYHGYRNRKFNSIYFTKHYYVISLTINLKTGNFTLLEKQKGGKKSTQRFVTNGFQTLHTAVTKTQSFFNILKTINKNSRLYDDISETFNNVEFSTKIQEALDIDFGCINYSNNPERFIIDLMDMFIKKKQIKVPDGDISYWFYRFYPTEKYLKKNDRKLLASILDLLGIKSKVTIKFLHLNPEIDIEGFMKFCALLGPDYSKYIGNLNNEVIMQSNRKHSDARGYDGINKVSLSRQNWKFKYELNNIERENIIKILNSTVDSEIRGNITIKSAFSGETFRFFEDHFNMINKVRPYDPDLYMKARTIKEFNAEHQELSKMISAIRKGWVLEYKYDDETVSVVEDVLETVVGDKLQKLYPHILKREEEYVEEGSYMHHCVASYADKDRSMIISVRDESGSDRVTCEFEIQTGRCVQKRYFCNAVPPDYFEDALILLEDRIMKRARWGLLNWKEKEKVPVMINGKPIVPEQKVQRVTDVIEGHRLPF
ncbi:MAG: PcfJ-like protein [Bacteroidota bacterium]|jgi:hypothetical protein